MNAPILVAPDLRSVITAVKIRPRYRANAMREVILAELVHGCDAEGLKREFWARYGFEPTSNLVAQQLRLLLRDGLIVRVRQGWYRLAPAAPAPVATAQDPFS